MPITNYFRYDTWVKSVQGPAIAGAQIYVCYQPANVVVAPPSPLALIYSDPNGLVPITQPIITDGFGHADFYALAGLYTVIVAIGGVIQQVYTDQSLGGIGTGTGGTALALQANGGTLINQMLLNFYSSDASVAITQDLNGDGGLNFQVESSGGFKTAGEGWFLGAQSWGPVVDTSGYNPGSTPNQVTAVQLLLDTSYTVARLAVYCVTGVGIGYMCCALYSADGNTKLIDAGVNAFDTSASSALRTVALGSPVVIPAGVYWFAFGTTDGGGSVISHGGFAYFATLFNASVPRFGTAANVISGGAMPATLGTITPFVFTGASQGNMPAVMFQV